MCSKEIGLHAQNLLTILDSIVNSIFLFSFIFLWGWGTVWPCHGSLTVSFGNPYQITMVPEFMCDWTWHLHPHSWISQKKMEFMIWNCLSCSPWKSNHLRPIYLRWKRREENSPNVLLQSYLHKTCKVALYKLPVERHSLCTQSESPSYTSKNNSISRIKNTLLAWTHWKILHLHGDQ